MKTVRYQRPQDGRHTEEKGTPLTCGFGEENDGRGDNSGHSLCQQGAVEVEVERHGDVKEHAKVTEKFVCCRIYAKRRELVPSSRAAWKLSTKLPLHEDELNNCNSQCGESHRRHWGDDRISESAEVWDTRQVTS